MAEAYSYTRFSSAQQATGDSLRRQTKLAEDYALRNGLTLNMGNFHDHGISAFKGKNVVEGALGAFIEAVEKGRIKKGSFLLVESLDRISRNEIDEALELFLRIIRLGITIVTLTSPEMVYSKEQIKADRGLSLIISITVMMRAHEESAQKSARVEAAWQQKFKAAAESGTIFSAMAPAWLSPSPDRKKWVIDRSKAKTVKRIFQLALEGHGSPTIAKLLNESKVPVMQRAASWTFGTVSAILKNEAVIGTYVPKKAQGQKIEGYYPVIIQPTQFHLAREASTKRRWIGGKGAADAANLFAGMSYCAACGARMRSIGSSTIKRKSGETIRHLYLQCLSSYSSAGTCSEGRFPYLAAEQGILRDVADTLASHVDRANSPEQVDHSVVLRAQIDDATRALDKLIDLSLSLDDPKVLATRINDARKLIAKLTKEVNEARSPIRQNDSAAFVQLIDSLLGIGQPLTPQTRKQLQVELRRIVQRVEFECNGGDGFPAVRVVFTPEHDTPPTSFPLGHLMQEIGVGQRGRGSKTAPATE